MKIFTSLLYLSVCAFGAWQALKLIAWHNPVHDFITRSLVAMSVFSTMFFAGYHLLGYITLVTGMPIVQLHYALALILASVLILGFMTHRTNRGDRRQAVALRAGFFRLPETHIAKVLILSYSIVAVMLVFGFPQGYEVLAYHLPTSVNILQSQSLQAWDVNFPHTYPLNASIMYAFFLDLLPEKLVSATDLILLIPLVFAVAGTSLLVGADRKASELVVCGLVTMPMIAFSSVELGADIGGIAFIAAAMYFALARDLTPTLGAVLAGLCAGLAFGFKSLHLVSIGFLALLIFAGGLSGACGGPLHKIREGTTRAAVFSGAALFTAGFWLIRNHADFGNPLYPVNLPILTDWLGWASAPDVDFTSRHSTQFEWVRRPAEWLVYPWIEWHGIRQNFKHSSGLGAFFAASVPVALVAVTAAVIAEGIQRHRDRFILLLATAFIILVWWVLDDRQPRYVMPAVIYSMPLVAWVVTQAHGKWRRVYDAVLILCVSAMLLVFLSKQALFFGDRIVFSRYTTRAQLYEYPNEVDALPAGATVLNLAARPWHYPLAGKHGSTRVISMQEGRRMLGLEPSHDAPETVELHSAVLLAAGVTHVFTAGATLIPDTSIRLCEVGRFDRNPTNGKMLATPRLLFAVAYAGPGKSAECDRLLSRRPNGGRVMQQ